MPDIDDRKREKKTKIYGQKRVNILGSSSL